MNSFASQASAKQQGFALLTVLMVVALVSIMGSTLLYEQHTNIKRSTHMLHQAQSLAVAWGVETWVKKGLQADAENNATDHLNEQWAQPLAPIPFEGGEISGQLIDLNGRINLNNVQETDAVKRKIWQDMIQRYARLSGIENEFSEILTDWVDADDERLPLGAESDAYLLFSPAYRAANQPLKMVSELRNLQGMQAIEAQIWQLFTQDLAALPTVTEINVNTANQRTLLSLADWMTQEIVATWMQTRLTKPAEQAIEFVVFLAQQTGFTEAEIFQDLPDGLLTVQSQYFLLNAEIDYGESQQGMSAIFYRKSRSEVGLVQRWLSVTERL